MATAKRNLSTAAARFQAARDLLLETREDSVRARAGFAWPAVDHFNWVTDWFDPMAADNDAPGLWVIDDEGERTLSFAELSHQSSGVAAWLRAIGVRRGDRVLLMLGNRAELWLSVLALIKLGAVIVPSSTLLTPADLRDRIERGNVRHVVTEPALVERFSVVEGAYTRIAVGAAPGGWTPFDDWERSDLTFEVDAPTAATDPLLLYFTSGTTAEPKLVEHTHASYPIGHLSTMYWLGVRPGDVHLNISSPGWAKHAWSSLFAPWDAEAAILVLNTARFSAPDVLHTLERCGVATFCAPPTVWRMLVQHDLGAAPSTLRDAVSAGEPLNPEIIDHVGRAWGLTIRDGYGQTETTAQIGNTPGQRVKPGSMGRPLPGYSIALIDPVSDVSGDTGEICIDLSERPLGLMTGYRDDPQRTAEAMRGGHYHTGDIASRDDEGYITYIGRADDVFKSSDYRISPFELESVLIEHPSVAEVGVVPSPDPLRLAVPKAFITLAPGSAPDRGTALSILRHAGANLAPYKRVRRIEFSDLPKTISGKIRRVDLRQAESTTPRPGRREHEYWEDDFPELAS